MLELRLFELTDIPAVRALHDRTPPDGQAYVGQVQRWPEELDHISANYLAFWVVVDGVRPPGECVVAMAGLTRPGADVPIAVLHGRTDVARLETMRVAIEHQRHGIGRRLVHSAVEFAEGRGCSAIILETTPQQVGAVGLYQSTAFGQVGSSTIGFEARSFDLLWFERRLGDLGHS